MTTPHDFAQQLRQRQAAKRPGPTPQDCASEQVTTLTIPTSVGAVPVYRHQPHFVPAQRVIINLHGSGFIFPHNAYDDLFAKQLCLSTQALVLDIDYPLAPEHPFPQPLQATYQVIQALQTQYRSLGAPTIIGHSAGGNLAIGTQLLAQRHNQPKADRVILDYPALDLDTKPADKPFPAGARAIISPELAETFNAYYRPNGETGNPLISPVTATSTDLHGFPPTFILTADHDSLMPEAEAFGQSLIAAGCTVTLHRYQNVHHGFTLNGEGQADQALRDILAYIQA
ncbi:carboxylesterase [Levilactobacillus namurensis DSM 19117]|uniref:Carboxylesterase n=1 Tax=Levilactobacillus namurensis DSM 19117 TaxID=1423773 RepID=A0A0R1JWB0_9LACO|nr:alpha/beta hydrolase [Levilactobacillus namurensis]KRK75456.1 carboxylesterase [Levilactobacillus namurensis DSM 19117]GEO75214.1 carboxylesterase [Levilactobacillus namurensis]